MKLSTFEKDNIIAIGPFTDDIYNILQDLKTKQSIKEHIQTSYLAYDFLSIQNYYQEKHDIFFHEDISDFEVKKIGSTYSRPLKRFYNEDCSTLFLEAMLKKDYIRAFSIFASPSAQFRSKFYVIKDTTPRTKWIIVTNPSEIITAKKVIKKINDRKVKKSKESINVQGFDFTAVIEALRHSTDDNYKSLYSAITLDGVDALFSHKIVRTNYSNYNLLGNLKKDIRRLIKHESQDVIELDLVAAYPGILPIYLKKFLTSFDQQYTSKLDRVNLNQPEQYKISLNTLLPELEYYISNCDDIYLHIQQFIKDKFNIPFERNDIKKAYLVFLFADPKSESKKPPISSYIKKYVKNQYPEIYNALLSVKSLIGYSQVAVQIQNIMANVMKDVIKLFQKTNKETPFIPIYDCFITSKDNHQLMYHSMKEVLAKYGLEHIKIKMKNITKENEMVMLTSFDNSTSLRYGLSVNDTKNNKDTNNMIGQISKVNKEIFGHQSGVPNILSCQKLPSRYKIEKVRDKIGFEKLYFHYISEKRGLKVT